MATALRTGDAVAPAHPSTATTRHAGYLFHPVVDFLMAGGGSILVALPVFLLIRNKEAVEATALWWGLVLANVLNFPHFANSYQLLYSGIRMRILGSESTRKVRLRYIWAGFVAPALIGGFLFGACLLGDVRLLGYSANAMAFFVGWHYVKQGYGVIAVLSAIRRIVYSDTEKRLLLLNGYAVWIYSWMALNRTLHEDTLYGVKYFTFDMPPLVLTIGALAATATTAAVVVAFAAHIIVRKLPVSWNGVVGYACSLYLWLLAFQVDPIFTIFIPTFHSLQYLLFTWRYQLNKVSTEEGAAGEAPRARISRPAVIRFAKFVVTGADMLLRAFLLASVGLAVLVAPAGAQLLTVDHPGQYTQEDIARGNLLYNAQCFQCHGRDGDQISGIDLRRGLFRRSQSDEDLGQTITRGTPGGMPPFKLDPAELTGIVAFIRAGFDTSASVSRRRRPWASVISGQGRVRDLPRVAGKGPRSAPDLSDIGLARAPAVLERSIRDPSAALQPINRPVRIVMRDGRTIRGRRLNEDTHTVQVIDEKERLVSIAKKDVRSFDVTTESVMPAYAAKLTNEEVADVLAYLLTLRRQ